jgi:hypothetical protein
VISHPLVSAASLGGLGLVTFGGLVGFDDFLVDTERFDAGGFAGPVYGAASASAQARRYDSTMKLPIYIWSVGASDNAKGWGHVSAMISLEKSPRAAASSETYARGSVVVMMLDVVVSLPGRVHRWSPAYRLYLPRPHVLQTTAQIRAEIRAACNILMKLKPPFNYCPRQASQISCLRDSIEAGQSM